MKARTRHVVDATFKEEVYSTVICTVQFYFGVYPSHNLVKSVDNGTVNEKLKSLKRELRLNQESSAIPRKVRLIK